MERGREESGSRLTVSTGRLARLRSACAGARGWYVLFALAGLLLNFHPTIFSGFRRVQTDPGDARVTIYALEHSYRWLLREPPHRDYWSPPVYHPAPNLQALMGGGLGALPLYAPWRLAGLAPDTAFQCWQLGVALANFAAFAWFLSGGLRMSGLAAAGGAFLFAFGLPRANLMHHPQFAPMFFAVLALGSLARLARAGEPGAARHIPAFFCFWAAQLWCGIQMFWLFSLGLAVALAWTLAMPALRAGLHSALLAQPRRLAAGALAFGLLVYAPLVHARGALAALELPPGVAGYALLPRVQSWFNAGPANWSWGRLFSGVPFSTLPDEHRLGLGLCTLALALYGLRGAQRPLAVLLGRTALTLMALATVFPVNLSPWRAVVALVPGARAVPRVTLLGSIVLIIAACGLAWAVETLRARRSRVVLALVLVFMAAEQGMTTWSFDKQTQRADVRRIETSITPGCRALLVTGDNPAHYEVSFKYHTDAMLASLALKVPTLNGPYGSPPASMQPFASALVPDNQSRQRLRAAISHYAARTGIAPDQVCWVHVTQPLNW